MESVILSNGCVLEKTIFEVQEELCFKGNIVVEEGELLTVTSISSEHVITKTRDRDIKFSYDRFNSLLGDDCIVEVGHKEQNELDRYR